MTTHPAPYSCSIVPPYLLEALATSGDPAVELRARETLRIDQLRYEQHAREHTLRASGSAASRRANRATTDDAQPADPRRQERHDPARHPGARRG